MTLVRPFPTDFELPTTPATEFEPYLPGDGLGPRADAALHQFAQYGFVNGPGLFLAQKDTMIAGAHHPDIADQCPNDAKKRTGDEKIMIKWMLGGRALRNTYHINTWSGEPLTPDDIAKLTIEDVTQDGLQWASASNTDNTEYKVTGSKYTTAYRTYPTAKPVLLERVPANIRMELGFLSATIMLADLVGKQGIAPNDLSLETNFSNERARRMYRKLGFVEFESARERCVRPTLQPLGTMVNGKVVRLQQDEEGRDVPGKHVVDDLRTFWRLADWKP